MSNKLLKRIVVVLGLLFVVFSFYFYQIVRTANFQIGKADTCITIAPNTEFKALRDSLYAKHVLHELISFGVMSKILKYNKNVKAGRYKIKSNMNNWDAIRMLRAGIQEPVVLTFNNVRTNEELAGKITKNLMIDSSSFLDLLHNKEYIGSYGFTKETIQGMFIPNSYQVYWTFSAEKIFERLHKEYTSFWNKDRTKKATQIGLTIKEVTTLASIVEAETAKNDEKRRVAGVYMNRIKRGMLLQADPTVKFAWGDFSLKRILFKHLEINSPYNTYKYKGLPPGPINSPSISSIDAVLHYENHEYIFFCAKEDFSGYHNFAKSASGHAKNRNKYIRALNKHNIK